MVRAVIAAAQYWNHCRMTLRRRASRGKSKASRPTAQAENAPSAPDDLAELDARSAGSGKTRSDDKISRDILIEIDPNIVCGSVRDRFDIAIRGWVVSRVPVAEITLQADGGTISAAFFNADTATDESADNIPMARHGFQFNLPRQAGTMAEPCTLRLTARTMDGLYHAEDFTIDVDAGQEHPATVVSGPANAEASTATPDGIIYIERAAIDPKGMLLVQGWAIALQPVTAVQIFAADELVAHATTGQARDDVAAAFSTYPNAACSGFNLMRILDTSAAGVTRIRARMLCSDGSGREESIPVEHAPEAFSPPAGPDSDGFSTEPDNHGDPPPPAPAEPENAAAPKVLPAEIRMFCDVAELTGDGNAVISGWAVCEAGIAQLRIFLDGNDIGLATYGHDRADVGSSFPLIRMAHLSGFRFERHIGALADGEHEIRVLARGNQDQELEQRFTVTTVTVSLPESEPTPEQDTEFRFELDAPAVSDGRAVAVITGRLTIDGWLLTRSGVASFEVFLDDQRLGDAHYGLARQDVGAAFPEWPNALRSGYAFHCPPRSLRNGDHTVRLRIRTNAGQELQREFAITVKKPEDQQDNFAIRRRVPRAEADMMLAMLDGMGVRPDFQILLMMDRTPDVRRLCVTLAALERQVYAPWTVLILAADKAIAGETHRLVLDRLPHLADRFGHITPSAADRWSAPLGHGSERQRLFHLILRPGDELGADALLELAVAACRNPASDMLYADEIRTSPVSQEHEPFLKPDFSIDLLLSTNYIGRPCAVASAPLARTGVTPAHLTMNGEYDLVLRCAEHAAGIRHVPKLLCRRSDADADDPRQEQEALRRMLHRQGNTVDVVASPITGTWRVKRAVPELGKVSIIIPTCAANGYIETCIDSLCARTTYKNVEIVCIDNIPAAQATWKAWLRHNADKVVDIPDAFNWSAFNNRAAELADGDFLLFLNDDIEIIQDDWLDAMLEHAHRPEVGITGPQLLYPDGKVQHAGMFLANNGIGRHAFRFAAKDDPCYFGLALTQRNVMAVTGACMLVRRDTFTRLGGFDAAHEIVNNDLDFCLRAHQAGLLTVYTPYATLIHHELASRANLKDVFNLTHFDKAWKTTFAAGDPYFNPRLSRHADDYRPDDEPVQWVVSGAPMFHKAEIRRILVVKLDHIGDFVTALPPIRRLKQLFPQATIAVLAGPASQALIALEPCIDEFIPFAFFHARSQLGERALTGEDHAALAAQLRPYRFDLAVDLRKHVSTRDILKHTGARFLAGYDYLGQFPFLDIALDWDGDRTLQRKRNHIIDDLMMLVDAVGHAAEDDRVIMQPGPDPLPLSALPPEVRALFAKPVVAIHPGAGNVTKQWPVEHFAALIDLLLERHDISVMLIGGPDEAEIADALISLLLRSDAVASIAGKTKLADLPRLLKLCALYIGNDSGPKHIAAAVGIPTIGIHSGVVDPVEWGPIGPNAVALRRNMTCSPCYLAKAEDCPRNLACLRLLEPNLVYETADLLLAPTLRMAAEVAEAQGPAYEGMTFAAGASMEHQTPDQEITGQTTIGATPAPPGPKPRTKPSRRQRAAAA
jgi:ADP-heptose:LPS heptosyltransferase/GT2 family glycosyltransferase